MSATSTKHEFKAEIKQLLDILVHSLYTNKEIFLRELISNASDALEKVRFSTSSNEEGKEEALTPEIRITLDKEAKTLTIADTGIGMTADELMQNIGTIAHSGSARFAEEAAKAAQSDNKADMDSIIGRFGVGFYSVYMVAKEVTVTTRSFTNTDAPAMQWTSDGKGTYELTELEGEHPHGTTILVNLNDDLAEEFTDEDTIKAAIKRHSNFIAFPIMVGETRVNTVSALWREPRFQIKQEQYNEFYTFLTYDTEEPFETLHTSVDAPVQFNSLLFIPQKDTDFLGMDRDNWGVDLYVRRVLIEKQNKDLIPPHLAFVKGVVDTEDLPLNISRETLQDNVLIRKISTTLTKQILKDLDKISKDNAERYEQFWNEHGKVFKTGYMDFANRDMFASLQRFNSSTCETAEELTSFEAYVERAKEGQKEIYYVYAPGREAAQLNPHLEIFRRKGIEVLYLYEPIDEFIMETVRTFNDFNLVAAEHAEAAKLDSFEDLETQEKPEELSTDEKSTLDGLLAKIKTILGDSISEVKTSSRLSDSPCCLANPDGQMTSSMEKIMRAMNKDESIPTKVLELNPDHELVRNMLKIYTKNENDPFIEQASMQLYESALLLEGYLKDPHALVGRIQKLLTQSSDLYLK
ncbi:MAG: molecular chaperone HtpG [Desulfovibrio sp.]